MRLVLFFLFATSWAWSQTGRVEQTEFLNRLVQRYEIKHGGFPSAIGNGVIYRSDVNQFFNSIDSQEYTKTYQWDKEYVQNELAEFEEFDTNFRNKWYKNFYSNPAYLFSLKRKDFWISINVGVNAFLAKETEEEYIVYNTRIARIKGDLGKRIYFSSTIYENQVAFPSYHRALISKYNTIPGQAFYKNYKFPYFNEQKGYDFLNADGVAGLKLNKFLNVEFGHGKHFMGYGDRSLLLSNYSTNYLFLRLNTSVWKFNYQNIFKELFPFSERLISGGQLLPKKYAASHLLSFRATKDLEFSLFETVVFARPNHFEFQYLNPIILYRSVEQLLNSSDNALIGAQGKWNFFGQFQLYGQVILDELNFGIIREDFSWWANKFGTQLGIKYVDALGIDHLDVQVEWNAVRPFTYTHRDTLEGLQISPTSYSHYSQPLAHPLGSNFIETIAKIDFMPLPKLFFHARYVFANVGLDSEDNFVGQNILIDYNQRNRQFDYHIGDGVQQRVQILNLQMQYMFYHNMNVELTAQYRNSKSDDLNLNQSNLYIGAGLRIHFFSNPIDY